MFIDTSRRRSPSTESLAICERRAATSESVRSFTKVVGFTYVEVPLYSRVNGYQLVPKVKASVGLLFHL